MTLALTVMEISPEPEHKRAVPAEVVRRIYELMGSNMTKVIPAAPADWRAEEQFQKWRSEAIPIDD